jgi:hypothetical protein
VTCHTHPCRPCAGTHILHYLPQGVELSPRGSWGICAPALPEVLTTYRSFPMNLWDRILPQAVITLNMLRTSRINPKLSAATHLFGQYDFNRAPMAPPGTRVIAHETPGRGRTWAPHGQDGWYIGPALEHYRCYTVYITKTRSNRTVETI